MTDIFKDSNMQDEEEIETISFLFWMISFSKVKMHLIYSNPQIFKYLMRKNSNHLF